MSLVPTVTNANPSLSLLGGGSGPSPPSNVSTISELYVSSISVVAPATAIVVTNETKFNDSVICGNTLNMTNAIAWASSGGNNSIQFIDTVGSITGVSTINGVVYPPPTSPPTSSTSYQLIAPTGSGPTIVLTGGTTGGASDCTAPWTGVVNDYYRVCITFTVSTTSGSPAADAFLFFQLYNNTIQQVHVPYASIAQGIPQQVSITARAATTTPSLQVGLNDSAGAVVTFNITNTAGAPSIVMEQLGAPLPSP